jgi:hypothetical protein
MQCKHVYLFHGLDGSPDGTSLKLEEKLKPYFPKIEFHRPWVKTIDDVFQIKIEPNSVIIGNSLGGLFAAIYQEVLSDDINVIALSSPTFFENLRLDNFKHKVIALYSSLDPVIKGRTNWQDYTNDFYDVPWMEDHNIDSHIYSVSYALTEFLRDPECIKAAIDENTFFFENG